MKVIEPKGKKEGRFERRGPQGKLTANAFAFRVKEDFFVIMPRCFFICTSTFFNQASQLRTNFCLQFFYFFYFTFI